MATLQEWQDYVDAYDSNSVNAQQNVNAILNDPTATAAEKEKAAKDWMNQCIYADWLHDTNDQIQDTGVIPSSLHFDGANGTGGYWKNSSNEIRSGFLYPYDNRSGWNIGKNTAKLPICNLDGELLTLDITSDTSNIMINIQIFDPVGLQWLIGNTTYDGILTWSFGGASASYRGAQYSGFCCNYKLGISDYPIHYDFNNLARSSAWNNPNWNCDAIIGYAFALNITGFDVDPDAPWDAYNDNILPNIDPDNAVFPGGYEPGQPDDPPDEPTDIPHDDGEPPEHQRDRAVGIPSQFITQYLLSYSQLQTFGLNLWQSWLTPNTDVWKNFFLPYASDFGTLNIGACLDFIISLRVYPVDFADYLDLIGSSAGLYMGTGHTDFLGSSCAITRKLFHAFDCGTCEVKPEKPYNDFRDMYNTSISVVLPYCGTVELTPSEVMYRNLRAYYYVDFQSGACTAVVEVEGDSGWYMVASKTGQMGFLLPITATNAGQLSAQFGKDATETLGTLAGWFFDTAKTIGNGLFGMAGSYLNKKSSEEEKLMGVGRAGFDMLVNHGQTNVGTGIELVNQSLNRLSRSGIDMPMLSGGGGTEALMFPDTPYIQIRRGKYAKPENYPHSQGFLNGSSNTIEYYKGAFQGSPTIDPSYQGRGLCKFTGVDSTGLTCNNDERVEIVALLESGIYI